MKLHTPISLLIPLLFTACGGGGDNTPADPKPAPPVATPDNKPQAVLEDVSLGDIMLPPRSVARPDAATQAKVNEAFAATNQLRAEKGLAPLTYNESLAAYATIRARELATQGQQIEHKRANGTNPLDDANFSGRGALAENIGADKNGSAASIIQAWRNSPHHYDTIISKDFQNIGIGYYYDPNSVWKYYWTQTFSGGSTNSIYRFITPIDPAAARDAVRNAVQYDSAARLTINAPLDRLGGGDTHLISLGREHRINLLPPRNHGWSYQTFGAISDNSGVPEAYFNVGKPFVPGDGAELHANYRGTAIGDLGQHDRVNADVSARLDYGQSSKTLSLNIHNATRSSLNANNATRDARLDFSDTLNWNGNTGRFESETGNARLYGGGEELGGQFSRAVGNEAYRGAYGAKKVQ